MAGCLGVFAARRGVKPDADPGGCDQIGDALRAGVTAICRNERSLACGSIAEHLKGDASTPKKIWEAIQTLFAAMNEVQESVVSRFGPRTRVAFVISTGYASMPPASQFVYAMLILIAEGNAWRVLIAAPNRELEPTNLRLLKSDLQRHGLMCLMP